MDSRTGDIYPTKQAALDANVPEKAIVTGPEPALRYLSRMVKRDLRERRRRKRQQQKAGRKANRR
jgi:hypothetical protein